MTFSNRLRLGLEQLHHQILGDLCEWADGIEAERKGVASRELLQREVAAETPCPPVTHVECPTKLRSDNSYNTSTSDNKSDKNPTPRPPDGGLPDHLNLRGGTRCLAWGPLLPEAVDKSSNVKCRLPVDDTFCSEVHGTVLAGRPDTVNRVDRAALDSICDTSCIISLREELLPPS